MPTYEFRCAEGHTVDRFYRKMSDAPSELECPVCGKVASRQTSGGAGLLFKGSGFYLTDYGRNAHRGPGGESKAGSSTSSNGSTGKTDAAPAAATAASGSGDSKSTKSDNGAGSTVSASTSTKTGS